MIKAGIILVVGVVLSIYFIISTTIENYKNKKSHKGNKRETASEFISIATTSSTGELLDLAMRSLPENTEIRSSSYVHRALLLKLVLQRATSTLNICCDADTLTQLYIDLKTEFSQLYKKLPNDAIRIILTKKITYEEFGRGETIAKELKQNFLRFLRDNKFPVKVHLSTKDIPGIFLIDDKFILVDESPDSATFHHTTPEIIAQRRKLFAKLWK